MRQTQKNRSMTKSKRRLRSEHADWDVFKCWTCFHLRITCTKTHKTQHRIILKQKNMTLRMPGHRLPQKVFVPREVPDGWHRHFMCTPIKPQQNHFRLRTFLERNNRVTLPKLSIRQHVSLFECAVSHHCAQVFVVTSNDKLSFSCRNTRKTSFSLSALDRGTNGPPMEVCDFHLEHEMTLQTSRLDSIGWTALLVLDEQQCAC